MSSFFKYLYDTISSYFSSVTKLDPIDYNEGNTDSINYNEGKANPINYNEGKTDPNQYYQNLLPNINSNLKDGKFCDPYFPNNLESITSKNNPLIDYNEYLESKEEKTSLIWKKKMEERDKLIKIYEGALKEGNLRWERISDILQKNNKTINLKEDMEVKIAQRGLGDCYLISFLRGFLNVQPEKYYKLLGQCHPEIGYYEINFFSNEKKNKNMTVFVDDYILLTMDSQPLFAGIREETKYAVGICLLIEKAYAKINGSYLNIEGSFQTKNPYYYFTGIPGLTYALNTFDNNKLYSFIDEGLAKKNVLTTGTPEMEKGKKFPINGISDNHRYTVISVEKNNEINIIDLNNPWGYNVEKEMNNFDIDLDDEEIKKKIVDFNKSKNNLKNGNLKLDFGNLINHFKRITLCSFRKLKEEQQKDGIKNPTPKGFPSDGFDDVTIETINQERIGIFDSLNIDKISQNKFFAKFNKSKELGLYIIFSLFMNFGARREVFDKLMESIDEISNDNINSQSQEDFSQQMSNLLISFPNYFQMSQ